MADIEDIYHQVLAPDDQQTILKFLWWSTDNINDERQDFMTCAHVFGGTSSASFLCAKKDCYRQQRSLWNRCSNYTVEELIRG